MSVERIWFALSLLLGVLTLLFAGDVGIPVWASNLRNPLLISTGLAVLLMGFSRRFRDLGKRALLHPETMLTAAPENFWFWAVSIFYLLFFLKVSFHNFFSFQVEAIDFSIFDFMLANTARGRFMESVWGTNHFGTHFTPVLFLLYPFHRLWTQPYVLLIAHPLILWSAVFPLYRLLREMVPTPFQRLLILFAFLNYNYLAQILAYNFHMEAFYVPGFFWFFWALRNRRWLALALASTLLLSVKEDAAIYLAAAAVGMPFTFRVPWILPCLLFVTSVALFVLNMKWIIPSFAGTSTYHVAEAAAAYGHTLNEIVPNILTRWKEVLRDLVTGRWLTMASPFLFLPLLVPFVLIVALPYALIHVLANSHVMKNLMLYYSAPYLPFLFFGFLYCLTQDRLPLLKIPFSRTAKSAVIWFTALNLSLFGGSYLSVRQPHSELRWLNDVRHHLNFNSRLCVQGILIPHLGYPPRLTLLGPRCLAENPDQVVVHPGMTAFPYSPEDFKTIREHFAQDLHYQKTTFGGYEVYTRLSP